MTLSSPLGPSPFIDNHDPHDDTPSRSQSPNNSDDHFSPPDADFNDGGKRGVGRPRKPNPNNYTLKKREQREKEKRKVLFSKFA